MTRTDALIAELSRRHSNTDPRFLAEVRPLVERILDPQIEEAARVRLLELLAETFERDARMREDFRRARAGFDAFFAHLRSLLDGRGL